MKQAITLALMAISLTGCLAPIIVPAAALTTTAIVGQQLATNYPALVVSP